MAHGHGVVEEMARPSTGLARVADSLDRFIEPTYRYIAYAGAGVLGLLVLMLMYSIIGRRFLSAPLRGSFELTELCLVTITFLVVAYECLGHEKMTVDIVSKHFPDRVQHIIQPTVFALVVIVLGVLCWQLIRQGIRVQGFHQTTRVLQIPIYPFLYLAAFGILTLIPVYLVRLLRALDKAAQR